MKVLSVIGTRPEAIKMAPVIKVLNGIDTIESEVCSTGQHKEMLDHILPLFDVKIDYYLHTMRPNQTLAGLTARVLEAFDTVLQKSKPDWVLVQGDTTTAMVAAMAAFYRKIKIGHVEAGLRTGNLYSPFPEEFNRRTIDGIATLNFAPTESAVSSLFDEDLPPNRIVATGNTIIDAIKTVSLLPYHWNSGPLRGIRRDCRIVLVTAHRRENVGEPMKQIALAINDLALKFADVEFVLPMHLNPKVREILIPFLNGLDNVHLLEPLDYLSLVNLLKVAHLAITDSGGLQEEAPWFGVPVLVARDSTERPEGVTAGVSRLVGTKRESIADTASMILTDDVVWSSMRKNVKPYGDGLASQLIVGAMLNYQ